MKKFNVNYWIYQVEEGVKTITADNLQQAEKEAKKVLDQYAAGCKYQIDSIEEVKSI